MELNWTREWPDKPGQYLFYGDFKITHQHDLASNRPRLMIVEVFKISNGLLYAAAGIGMFKSEWEGLFTEFDLDLSIPKEMYAKILAEKSTGAT